MPGRLISIAGGGSRITTPFDRLLSDEDRELAREQTRRWIKSLRLVRYDGATMRERFRYRDDSLWWFTEIYLHKTRHLEQAVATVIGLEAACRRHEPARLELDHPNPAVQHAARAFAGARGIPLTITTPASFARDRWSSYLVGLSARLSRLRPGARHRVRKATIAAFVHSAFWRDPGVRTQPSQESYIGPVLDSLSARLPGDGLICVGMGPRRNFRARRWWDPLVGVSSPGSLVIPIERLAPRAALRDALSLWSGRERLAQAVTAGAEVRAAGMVRGCDLWPILSHELEGAARLQWPWSARAMDEAGAALDALTPDVAVTYAEAGGWGRALVLEARRRGIPSVGLQHGFIYRHWLNYLHEPDELEPHGTDRGFPCPSRTLLFDGYAARHLAGAGHLPPGSLRVTGNPRLDDLTARFNALSAGRDRLRHELGVPPGGHLAVLTAKFSEIHDDLPDLFGAVAGLPEVRLCIKAHPAEIPDLYVRLAGAQSGIRVEGPESDLARLLAAADTLVTMNSTVAIDALSLGIPALVIGRQTNLQPFVDAGVMLGAAGEKIPAALRTVLYDREAREGLLRRARTFIERERMRADGRAAERAADEILQAARLGSVTDTLG